MSNALVLVGWSLAISLALYVLVGLLCRTRWLWQRPALGHLLWLLVLVKLIVPSFVSVAVLPMPAALEANATANIAAGADRIAPAAIAFTNEADAAAPAVDEDAIYYGETPRPVTDHASAQPTVAAAPAVALLSGRTLLWGLVALSLGVSGALGLLALLQCREVYQQVISCPPDLGRAASLLREVAAGLRVKHPPSVIVVNTNIAPMLWGGARQAVIILPKPLVEMLDDDAVRSILAHELAHYVRRDHWSNTFAFCVAMLMWWNPLAWLARRHLTAAAELSCDAMVVERLSGSRKCYAQTLLRVVDFVAGQRPRRLAVAVTFDESRSLRRRFEMLADARITSKVSRWSWALLLLGAATSVMVPARAEPAATRSPAPAAAATSEPTATEASATAVESAPATDRTQVEIEAGAVVNERGTPEVGNAKADDTEPSETKPDASKPDAARQIEGFGTVVDPDGDCQFKEYAGGVTVTIPGTWHDLTYTKSYARQNAPRILQDAKGDFSLEGRVEVFALPTGKRNSGGAFSFVSAGLLLWQDDKNFIRLERAAYDDRLFIWVERFEDGKSKQSPHHGIDDRAAYLRVTRIGNVFTFEASEDGEKWVRIHRVETKLAENLQVGVLAINTTAEEFAVRFKGLKLTAPVTVAVPDETAATSAGGPDETGIYLMKTDGTEARKLVSVDGYEFHGSPRWSHSGTQLVFDAVTGENGKRRFFVVNADGSGLQELGAEAMPDWSPNDEQLIFQDQGSIWIQNGVGRKRLTTGGCARWSPDGTRIVFTDRRTIKIYKLADGTEEDLVDMSFDEFPHGFDWSRDGKQIAFTGRRAGAQVRELFIVDMTQTPPQARVRYAHDGSLAKHIHWSPDGKQLAITIGGLVHLLEVEGTAEPRLLPGENKNCREPTWSPDGKWFVFSRRPR
jgi:beta-lactamase regulating signal transducer with metallopeptidase domain/Tol biopolymer transport system component/regulation of enolase protein 1 (concanavalin A-like superfamily)